MNFKGIVSLFYAELFQDLSATICSPTLVFTLSSEFINKRPSEKIGKLLLADATRPIGVPPLTMVTQLIRSFGVDRETVNSNL